jgi:O-6-methylguanine DNA methyltransferase
MKSQFITLAITTSDGEFVARYSERGLAGLSFPTSRTGRTSQTGQMHQDKPTPDARPAQVREWHRVTTAALKRVLAGRAAEHLPPLDLSVGTDFQRAVWQAMQAIPTGQTRSYGEIARSIGRPKAVRAVGGACGANPIPVLVPCHRVLAAHQKLGGFSADPEWKRTLLQREGASWS